MRMESLHPKLSIRKTTSLMLSLLVITLILWSLNRGVLLHVQQPRERQTNKKPRSAASGKLVLCYKLLHLGFISSYYPEHHWIRNWGKMYIISSCELAQMDSTQNSLLLKLLYYLISQKYAEPSYTRRIYLPATLKHQYSGFLISKYVCCVLYAIILSLETRILLLIT